MGLDDLIARLEKDADARVAEVESRARAEIDAIRCACAAESSEAEHETLAERRASRRAALDRELAAAHHAALRRRLEARHALAERVMARARTIAETVTHESSQRLQEAMRYAGKRQVVVRNGPLGFVIATADGTFEIDDTILVRLERLRPILAMDVVREVDP